MAEKAGVSRQVVQFWLKKKRIPSWRRETVLKLAGQ